MSMPEPTLGLLECFLGFGRAIRDNHITVAVSS
jgi:hypothetical protein